MVILRPPSKFQKQAAAFSHGVSQRRPGFHSRPVKSGICGGQNGTGTGSSPSTSVSSISIILQMLHTHPFLYHRRYIILAIDRAVK